MWGICGIAIVACFIFATLYYGRVLPLPPKKTYIVYYEDIFYEGNTMSMLVNKRSPQKAIKAFYDIFGNKTYLRIIKVVEAEEVFETLRMGDKTK